MLKIAENECQAGDSELKWIRTDWEEYNSSNEKKNEKMSPVRVLSPTRVKNN
jgi:hypothetical protein